MIEINSKVSDFTLQGIDAVGNEKTFSLSDFAGQNIVLYFYPKDNTPGCTQEACNFRDNFNRLISKAVVIGVSADSIASHKKFQEQQSLNFILLSDPEHKLLEKFEAWGEKKMYGKSFMGIIRSTFIIDKEGIVKKIWENVNVKGHVDEVLEELEKIN
ncbi:MAG: thioredoxin-dependent thiol peroxidase [Candidatus Gastranaerophilaceae bacterium]